MARQTYYEMLRDPRWQKKRLEIMNRDEFKCLECGDATTTLNVHHGYYAKGRKPWEYEDESLRTLCQPCHEMVTDMLAEIQAHVGALSAYSLDVVLGFVRALDVSRHWECYAQCNDDTPSIQINNYEEFSGVAAALHLTEDELYAFVGNKADRYEPLYWHQYQQIFANRLAARRAAEVPAGE